eukprot:scaffold394528_cov48-Prasinocladus_malaysianus.AAC.1
MAPVAPSSVPAVSGFGQTGTVPRMTAKPAPLLLDESGAQLSLALTPYHSVLLAGFGVSTMPPPFVEPTRWHA